jgi:hypothetical protein
VDALAVDRGAELGVRVELGLPGAPVVGRGPVVGEVAQVVDRDAAGPADTRQRGRPAGGGYAGAEIRDRGLGDRDLEVFQLRCAQRLVEAAVRALQIRLVHDRRRMPVRETVLVA